MGGGALRNLWSGWPNRCRALSQVGNVGGEPYWSWYGFGSRVEWCACFVSWCANECGYIDTGVIPKFAGCVNGVQWFRERGQWADNDIEPAPGMIIFFDWDNKGSSGPQDGESDHTGIVERVEDGIVYTVEGNSGDSCRENHYAVGYYEILGYELEDLIDGLSEVIADKESLYISDFMEPYLKFAIASTDGKILLGMEFVYEANKTSWTSHKVSEVITKESAEEIAEELRSMLARFPQR